MAHDDKTTTTETRLIRSRPLEFLVFNLDLFFSVALIYFAVLAQPHYTAASSRLAGYSLSPPLLEQANFWSPVVAPAEPLLPDFRYLGNGYFYRFDLLCCIVLYRLLYC